MTGNGAADAAILNVLVLAADRGSGDPVAQRHGLASKCLVPVAGIAMLERVVGALQASKMIGRIVVLHGVADLAKQLPGLAPFSAGGRLSFVEARETPSLSVLRGVESLEQPFPLIVTTADHALLTSEMVDHFCRACVASHADVCVGLTARSVIMEKFPETRRTYLKFRDEAYSGSNLFALRTPAALRAVELWRRVEQQRKKPWRIAGVFGPRLLLGYLLRWWGLDDAIEVASRRLGILATAVKMPFAEAAIDVDTLEDLDLVETILGAAG